MTKETLRDPKDTAILGLSVALFALSEFVYCVFMGNDWQKGPIAYIAVATFIVFELGLQSMKAYIQAVVFCFYALGQNLYWLYRDLGHDLSNLIYLFDNLTPNFGLYYLSYFSSLMLLLVGATITLINFSYYKKSA